MGPMQDLMALTFAPLAFPALVCSSLESSCEHSLTGYAAWETQPLRFTSSLWASCGVTAGCPVERAACGSVPFPEVSLRLSTVEV